MGGKKTLVCVYVDILPRQVLLSEENDLTWKLSVHPLGRKISGQNEEATNQLMVQVVVVFFPLCSLRQPRLSKLYYL